MSHRNLLSLTKCLLLFSLFEPLDAEERRIMQEHPVTGENICKPLKSLRRILPVIRHHHEKMDGSRYPDGLRGEAIPLKARILQVADVYDALTTDRPYRGALSPEEALQTLFTEAGIGWLDASVVLKLSQICRDGECSSCGDERCWPPTTRSGSPFARAPLLTPGARACA